MDKKIILLFCSLFLTISSFAQNEDFSPYEISWAVDGTWIGVGLGLNAVGLKIIKEKDPFTATELRNLSKENVPKIDRWLAGQYSEKADRISDYPFYGSFAVPFAMLLANDFRPHAKEISVLYLETMATTGALYTITAGLVSRPRPFVYNEDLPDDLRRESKSRRSFFGGHVAATASATFFAAKIFNDFNPDSAAKIYVWSAAAIVPAWVSYLRTKAGKHFLTDNLLGYGVGALSGILIPELHKKENSAFTLVPSMSDEFKGFTFLYSF